MVENSLLVEWSAIQMVVYSDGPDHLITDYFPAVSDWAYLEAVHTHHLNSELLVCYSSHDLNNSTSIIALQNCIGSQLKGLLAFTLVEDTEKPGPTLRIPITALYLIP